MANLVHSAYQIRDRQSSNGRGVTGLEWPDVFESKRQFLSDQLMFLPVARLVRFAQGNWSRAVASAQGNPFGKSGRRISSTWQLLRSTSRRYVAETPYALSKKVCNSARCRPTLRHSVAAFANLSEREQSRRFSFNQSTGVLSHSDAENADVRTRVVAWLSAAGHLSMPWRSDVGDGETHR